MKIPATKIEFSDNQRELIRTDMNAMFETGRLILGPYAEMFERQWAEYVGRAHGVAVNCDTAALEISLNIIGVKGKEVILPSTSFFSCVIAIRRAGGIPVVVDVDTDPGGSPVVNAIFPTTATVVAAVTENTAAFMAVYTAGWIGCDIVETCAALKKLDIPVIEDCAHVHGSRICVGETGWPMAGTFGDIATFSFYATKNMTTGGEGGIILTDDAEFAKKAKMYRNYGRASNFGSDLAEVEGYNWRMSELHAIFGLAALSEYNENLEKRHTIAALYTKLLNDKSSSSWKVPVEPFYIANQQPSYYRYILLTDIKTPKIRDTIKADVEKLGVTCLSETYEMTITKQKIFPELHKYETPAGDQFCDSQLCLPMYDNMRVDEIEYVVDSLYNVCEEKHKVKIRGSKVVFSDDEIKAATDSMRKIMQTGYMTLGACTDAFEKKFDETIGTGASIAVANDIAAFEIAFRIACPEGGEVVFAGNSFAGPVVAALRAGCTVNFVDIDVGAHLYANVDQIKDIVVEGQTSAVVIMNTAGLVAADIGPIVGTCKNRGAVVIEDCAHATGSEFEGRSAGTFGDISVWSFYATKVLNTGEGGMLSFNGAWNTAENIEKAKCLRNYGIKEGFGHSELHMMGNSWRMTEMQASIGVGQLDHLESMLDSRRKIGARYANLIPDSIGPYAPVVIDPEMDSNYYRYVLVLQEPYKVPRAEILKEMENRNATLAGAVYETPAHMNKVFGSTYSNISLPEAEKFCLSHLCLPVYVDMTPEEVEHEVSCLKKVIEWLCK